MATKHHAARGQLVVRYKECLYNHASPTMGSGIDGCSNFTPSRGEELQCEGCGCHRKFHRREEFELNLPRSKASGVLIIHGPAATSYPLQSIAPACTSRHAPTVVQLQDEAQPRRPLDGQETEGTQGKIGAKRHRTKFTQAQMDQMKLCAERLGWRARIENRKEIIKFCEDIEITPRAFKVWINNNKKKMASG